MRDQVFKNRELILKWGIALVSLYSFMWLCIGAYYSYPCAEDLVITAESRDLGIIGSTVKMLLTYDGRYTVNLLHGINPLAFGFYYGYKLMPVFTFGLLTFALYLLLSELFSHKKKVDHFIFAFALVTLFFSILDLAPAIYWMICTFVYIYPLIFFLFFFRAFLVFIRTRKKRYFAYSVLFLILSIGSCELHIPIFGLVLLLMLLHFRRDEFARAVMVRHLIVYTAASLLFVTSPGISTRFQRYEESRFDSWQDLLSQAGNFMVQEFNTSGSVALFLFLLLFAAHYSKNGIGKHKILIFMLGTGTVYLTWLIMLYLKNDGYPSRIVSVPVSVAVVSVLFISFYQAVQKILARWKWILFALFVFTSFFLENSYSYIREDYTSGKMHAYKQLMDSNYEILIQKRHTRGDCYANVSIRDFNAFVPPSIGIRYMPILPNRQDNRWNVGYESYFQLDEVRLKNDTVTIQNQIHEVVH